MEVSKRIRQDKEKIIQKVEEIRDTNIKVISKTDNFKSIKQEIMKIEDRGVIFNLDIDLYESLIEEAFMNVKECFRTDKSFTILPIIESMGVSYFFDYFLDGEDLISVEKKKLLRRERIIERIKLRIKKAEAKGDFEKSQKEKTELEKYENPEKYYSDLAEIVRILEKLMEKNLEKEELMKYSQLYKEKKAELKKAYKEKELTESMRDNIEFSKGIHYDIREYVLGLFFEGNKPISESLDRFLKGFNGTLNIDFVHIYILYMYMKKYNLKNRKRIKGLLYFYLIYELKKIIREIEPLISYSKKGRKVKYTLTPDGFGCQNINSMNRKIMLDILRPVGYDCYYVSPEGLNLVSFLSVKEIEEIEYSRFKDKFKEAQNIVKSRNNGVLFDFLKKEEENNILPYILNESYPINYMDGDYKENLYRDFIFQYFKEDARELNLYNLLVKPISLDIMGSLIRGKFNNLNRLKDKDAAFIYYLNENTIGIAIREDLPEVFRLEIFGNYYKTKMLKVERPTLDSLIDGDIF